MLLFLRQDRVPCWIVRSLLAAVGATVAATLPLGSPSVLAAGSHRVTAPTLLRNACETSFAAAAFRVQGHLTSGRQTMNVDVYFGSAGDLMTVTQKGDQTFHVIENGPSVYMNANRAFWLANSNNDRAVASLFSGRWIDMTSDKKDTAGITNNLTKETLFGGACSTNDFGSTSYTGKAVLNGVKVLIVHQSHVKNPGTFYIENGPTPYLLRGIGTSQNDGGFVTFSKYGVQPNITAPAGAIPISQLSGNSG
jgi:hypothetical protein